MRFLLLIAGLVFSLTANAKLFSNSYLSFELPPNWDCKREGTEWLCISQFSQKAKEAIIILTAKEVGPTDSLSAYMAHLKEPRTLPNKVGPATPSKVMHVQQRTINNHPWVDGLHQGSEVSTYYTRYLATVKEKVAVLVTFSAHRSHYTQYSNDFIRAIDSLRVTAAPASRLDSSGPRGPKGPGQIGQALPGPQSEFEKYPGEDSSGGAGQLRKLFGLGLIIIALGLFIFMRSRKKRKR